ncbi:MAG TPA: cytochrome c [Gammaproteobacteria bacterium]|nr:cytochrome c [Gammaproteobacteria bacterium]
MSKNCSVIILILVGFLLAACDSLDPQEIRKRQHLPGKDFVADPQKGKVLFSDNCSRCHGTDARGTNHGPPLVHNIYRPGHHADISFHWAVKNGVKKHHWDFGDMPPIPNLTPEETGHIIAYIRKEQRTAGIQ